jgi:septal ring factor EnvC (AmiA/AmiB activator)
MNRAINYLNFLGILALSLLCARQWTINSQLENRVGDLRHQIDDQLTKIAAQQAALQQNADDMKDLHQRITLSESQLEQTTRSLKSVTAERDQYRQVHDQLLAAVKQRDQLLVQQSAVLKTQGETIRKLAEERNEDVLKFNDLATKYNALVAGTQK